MQQKRCDTMVPNVLRSQDWLMRREVSVASTSSLSAKSVLAQSTCLGGISADLHAGTHGSL